MKNNLTILVIETVPASPHPETAIEILKKLCASGGNAIYYNAIDQIPVHDWFSNSIAGKQLNPTLQDWSDYLTQNLPEQTYVVTQKFSISEAVRKLFDEHPDPNYIPDLLYGFPFKRLVRLFLNNRFNIDSETKDIIEDSFNLHRAYLWSAILIFELTYQLLQIHKPTRLLIFNGRTPTTMPQVWAASVSNTPMSFHERGADMHRFWLTDFQLTSLLYTTDAIVNHSIGKSNIEIELESNLFFTRNREKKPKHWHSYAKEQEEFNDFLRSSFPKTYWVFLLSTTDELDVDFQYNPNSGLGHQLDALQIVAGKAKKNGIELMVRCHPNQGDKPYEIERIKKITDEFCCQIVLPRSSVNSLALCLHADRVFAYTTSLIFDIMYCGKAVGVVGRAVGSGHLESCEITNLDALDKFIEQEPVVQGRFARLYGYFMATYGSYYEFYRPLSLHHGHFL